MLRSDSFHHSDFRNTSSSNKEKLMLPEDGVADFFSWHSDMSDDTSISTTTTDSTSSHHNMKQKPNHQQQQQPLGIQDFRILKPIGAGDIGKVYLCQLLNSTDDQNNVYYYAMKVMDRDVLELKKKTHRAQMEKDTLELLDHPFLPKLIAHIDASPRFSCNVIDYCSGGDLHSLRYRQPNNRFSLSSARFYAAEVLMALEYLHMLGIVYRDLKPENILVRSDGHIMLTDFDLCLRSSSTPTLQQDDNSKCNQQPYCIPNYLRSRKVQTLTSSSHSQQRTFVAEPTSARSSSFVGTHEYVAPEVASGNPHGSAVDWWAFGIFLYEMMYGCTPFAGESNEITLRNIVKMTLAFPRSDGGMRLGEVRARDLIVRLLNKDAASRLGSRKGAAEIKSHDFFKGLNFALIRSSRPPEIPGKGKGCKRISGATTAAPFDCF